MTTKAALVHSARASESDLLDFAQFWQWERTIRERLPRVLEEKDITTFFQPIFELGPQSTAIGGYEVLARFPSAPRIPVGMWFLTARTIGLDRQLELVTAQTAAKCYTSFPTDAFISINSSLQTVTGLVNQVSPEIRAPLVIDINYTAIREPECGAIFDRLRRQGVQVALDNTPLDRLHKLRPIILELKPDYVKVDVLAGLADNPMGSFNLADGATWCHDSGIALVAERVESPEDLAMLLDLGVTWAQGYSLSDRQPLGG